MNICDTLADLQSSGSDDVSTDVRINFATAAENSSCSSFKTLVWLPSTPGDLLIFNFFVFLHQI